MTKKIILLAVILIAGAWGVQKWKTWKPATDPDAASLPPTTAAAETRNITFFINAAGEIGPVEQVSVRPEVSALIMVLPVDIGDVVHKDDLLAKLDDRDLQVDKQSAEMDIEKAKLELEQAKRNYDRSVELFKQHLISDETFDDTKTQWELATNALLRAQRDLDAVNEKIRKTVIRAPFDCTILTRPVSVGQAVAGSSGYNAGTEILTIADLRRMLIVAHINQADITRLRPGQKVDVQVEAVPGLQLAGIIDRIAPQATIKNNIKGFDVRILLKNPDQRVRPGMTANIRIPVASAANVTAVPLSAVFTDTDPETQEIERYVYVKKGDKFERRPVQIGVCDYFYAEVQRGLSRGDVVSLVQPKPEDLIELAQNDTGDNSGGAGLKTASPFDSGRAAARPSVKSAVKAKVPTQ